ncbi:MAG: nicotinamide-nucleotide adenylyltransferase [Candidatus Bathyarchaeota archaeon]|nr:MAG: nicotinamide-nucleotide adenylyltransferase [Candidatus Bathyarchaeota archaeon]
MRGLYIGRFQPFHLGHLHAVKYALEKIDEVIIVVGSAQHSHTLDNPFTAGERMVMIREGLKEGGIPMSKFWIIPIRDLNVHMMWVSEVKGYTPEFERVYSNEPLTRRLFLEAGYQVESIPFKKRSRYLATEIRRRMVHGENWNDLVPSSVAQFIEQINGVERLIDLTKTDNG